MPMTNKLAAPNNAIAVGIRKFLFRFDVDALRQAINGQMPVNNNNSKPMGMLTWLKKGVPTLIFTPRTASEMMGNIVPQRTANAIPTKITLLNRKLLSREIKESSWFSLLRLSNLIISSHKPNIKITAINPKNQYPIEDFPKACTEEITPLRVRKVPKITNAKVNRIKTIFHTLSMPSLS